MKEELNERSEVFKTVGLDEEMIMKYVKYQEHEEHKRERR